MKIIAITGTKGKTTIARMIDYVIRNLTKTDTLRVDSDGHFINGRQKSVHQDSLNMTTKASTVCPGRYLLDLYRKNKDGIAVLECALGCGGPMGMGFRNHNIGVFSNVFEDHIDFKKIKNKEDVFKRKSFIIKNVVEGGYLVANFDDSIIAKNAEKMLPEDSRILPFGREFKYFDIAGFLNKTGNYIITYDDRYIILQSKSKKTNLIDYTKISITYNGEYTPSIYNIMAVYGAILSYLNFDLSYVKKINDSIENFSVDIFGARLVNFKCGGKLVIIDFAHEKESLKMIAQLGHKLGKRVIGVLRLAPDRTDKQIFETGESLADFYDKLIIYDKIDGVKCKIYEKRNLKTRKIGDVSKVFYGGFIKGGKDKKDVEVVIIEEEAIKRASEISKKDDVVIIISGDDHKETYNNVKKYFSE